MDINKGINHLRLSDPLLAEVIDTYPPPALKRTNNLFESLLKYIVYQQLSTSSASAIFKRFKNYFTSSKISSKNILSSPSVDFKSLGLSKQKIEYIFSLAHAWPTISKKLKDIDYLSDKEIGKVLTPLKGIGPWTVDMFLIFSLARPDVLPVGDLVIKKGYAQLYAMKQLPSEVEMIKIAEKWRPFRTLASLYLWDMIDGPFEW